MWRTLRPVDHIYAVRWMSSSRDRVKAQAEEIMKREFRDLYDAKYAKKRATVSGLIAKEHSIVFPRIKTTSLSTKRIVIQDEAKKARATLLELSFRMSGANQNKQWIDMCEKSLRELKVQSLYLTVNETFLYRALSGFIQSTQRRKIPLRDHDSYIVFNSPGDEILKLTQNSNRLVGYLLLLDREARVRWYGYGAPDESSVHSLQEAANAVVEESKNF
ncbi:hypothetical protein NDN08_008344 [Rhodosorus marinus]|uniref:Uncharacterized protein n=1 Tax=Rhodosorus marinus TaxID=101924 RepID=A0AAV8V030_9RHOD|nr:hypothetical protein NDN08_008344 [Rhodosorus marinus]